MEKVTYWRGVEGVTMIWHGELADPELKHGDFVANYWDVEDTMWERFIEHVCCKKEEMSVSENIAAFNAFCQERPEEIYELIEIVSEY